MHIRLLLLLSLCSMPALGMESNPTTKTPSTLAELMKKVTNERAKRKEGIENNKAAFWVEKPQDKYWNTSIRHVIIEAIEQKSKFSDRTVFEILSPEEFKPFSGYRTENWIECDGPSRELPYDEYVDLIHKLLPGIKAPK